MTKPLILVSGATGAQGKSVAKTLVSMGYPVRGLTRDPSSAKAKSAAEGVELVKASLQNKTELKAAFVGVERAFLVTQFWEKLDVGDELLQGKNFIDAAKAAGVKFIVFSSLEDEGEHDVPHLRSKVLIEAYLKASGIPYATVRYPFYYDNWIYFMPPRKDEGKEDSYTLVSPTGQEAWHQISVADGGPVVAKMLADPAAFEGKCIGLAGDKVSGAQVAAKLSQISGKTVNFYPMPIEEYAKLGFPGADELAEMFKVFLETDGAVRDIAITKELNPTTLSFDQWADENKEWLISSLFTPK